jgi:hypothetical protein
MSKILVLTSCTAKKKMAAQLRWADFEKGTHLTKSLKFMPAGEMYTGEQHVRLMRGVRAARAAGVRVDVWILSAGYGLIPETQSIAPYEATFLALPEKEVKRRADILGLPKKVPELLNKPGYDLKVIMLGEHYLKTFSLADVRSKDPILILGSKALTELPTPPALYRIILENEDTRRFGCGLVGLKGEVVARILGQISDDRKVLLTTFNKAMLATRWSGPRQYSLL